MITHPDVAVRRYADTIMDMIDLDIRGGRYGIPFAVASFAALHSYVDANDYYADAGIDLGDHDMCNEVGDEVTRRLQERVTAAGFVQCANPDHDHTTPDDGEGGLLPDHRTRPQQCYHCHLPTHYDETAGYQHDDPDAPDCFAISRRDDATPCEAVTA